MSYLYGILAGVIGFGYAGVLVYQIKHRKVENEKVKEISGFIHEGAMVFLHKEYRVLAIFVVVVTLVIGFSPLGWVQAGCFIFGSLISTLTVNIGMRIATLANARTAEATKHSLFEGLKVAFSSGSVMGLSVTGLSLVAVGILYTLIKDPNVIYSFGFGASSVALFVRVGGGIYTKAVDAGANLVGKVEAGILEDDSRNPATIADNVGDNVSDVAGMGTDLFESYSDSLIAAMAIGATTTYLFGAQAVVLPILICGLGIIASLFGNVIIKTRKTGAIHKTLNYGIWSAAIFVAIFSYFVVRATVGDIGVYWSILVGLVAGIVIGLATEFYTSEKNKSAQAVALASLTGPATNVISGFALGLMSTVIPVFAVSVAIWVAYGQAGVYGIAMAAVGMLATLGITLAIGTYGPVVDNAATIAKMAGLGEETRRRAEQLDAVGNTSVAIGKGFAIGSATLTALVLLISYGYAVNISIFNILDPKVLIGLFIGGLLPVIFSALTMQSVGTVAQEIVNEVRRQFKEISGIMEGTGKPDYKRCITISTASALKHVILPGVIAVLMPLLVGFILGKESLAGLLVGSTITGFLLAVIMTNAGGAWDNAKKYIEEGSLGGRGSDAYKAAVIGDTVGNPFKDTSGPSLNILIKLIAIIAIIIAPLL
jgi:K(+)-stimulated pyrophosphate-energized sodium pump